MGLKHLSCGTALGMIPCRPMTIDDEHESVDNDFNEDYDAYQDYKVTRSANNSFFMIYILPPSLLPHP